MVTVKGYWKNFNGLVTYGYCDCGREVKKSDKYIDEKCPMCGVKLVWDLDNYELWTGHKK